MPTPTIAFDVISERADEALDAAQLVAKKHRGGLRIKLVGNALARSRLPSILPPELAFWEATETVVSGRDVRANLRLRDSSMRIAASLLASNDAHAFLSSGDTGTFVALGASKAGRIAGYLTPMLACHVPSGDGVAVMLDVGAIKDFRLEHVLEAAWDALPYARVALGISEPRVGLLNIGTEPRKGSPFLIDAYALLRERLPQFIGNVEPACIAEGKVDVVIADAIAGNLYIKTVGAVLKHFGRRVKGTPKLYQLLALPALLPARQTFNPELYNGAWLLGLAKPCIKAHGSTRFGGFVNALESAYRAILLNEEYIRVATEMAPAR